MTEFNTLFGQADKAFKQSRTAKRALELAHGLLNCMGRRTVTGMITANGQQFKDWTAAYRLFNGLRMNLEEFYSTIRKELVTNHLADQQPVYAHMDDTNLRKRGKQVAGTSLDERSARPSFSHQFYLGAKVRTTLYFIARALRAFPQ